MPAAAHAVVRRGRPPLGRARPPARLYASLRTVGPSRRMAQIVRTHLALSAAHHGRVVRFGRVETAGV